ncbi:MAG TPA: hypothetical protein V6C76_18125 [Drouetiella sp.]
MRAANNKILFTGLVVSLCLTIPNAYSQNANDDTPEVAFQKFRAASIDPKTSMEELNGFRTKSAKTAIEKEPTKYAAADSVVRKMVSQDWRVARSTVSGDKAELSLVPTSSQAALTTKMTAIALMLREDGQWKFDTINLHIVTDNTQGRTTAPKAGSAVPSNLQKAYAAAQAPFTQTPVQGKFNGRAFKPTEFTWDGANLSMVERGGNGTVRLVLSFDKTMNTIGMKPGEVRKTVGPSLPLSLKQGARTEGPHARLELADANDAFFNEREYGVHLSLGAEGTNGLVPGFIVLATPDGKTTVSGYFYAKFDKTFL